MSKFNSTLLTHYIQGATGPVVSKQVSTGTTHEGAPGFERDDKSELFLLAVTNLVGENTFYEKAYDRDNRFGQLVRKVAQSDPDWLIRFGIWLRGSANMRSASLVLAAEAVASGVHGFRPLVAGVLKRADEPGEMLAYWLAHHGKAVPKPVKRGIADAVRRMYTERNAIKYDTPSHAVRFADTLRLTHAEPRKDQDLLFHHLIGKRLGLDPAVPARMTKTRLHEALRSIEPDALFQILTEGQALATGPDGTEGMFQLNGTAAGLLEEASVTWEQIPSLVNRSWTKELWEAIIPSMGYMALLRNLRNFDQAGVRPEVAKTVIEKLSDPAEVRRSRQLPMRFLSAYNAAPSLRWGQALEEALQISLENVPVLKGNTLILIDTSGSMNSSFSRDGKLMRWDAAAMFGLALASRAERADVVSFSHSVMRFQFGKGESLLRALERWRNSGYMQNGGTYTSMALQQTFKGHDRVIILTDEQAHYGYSGGYGYRGTGGDVGSMVPATTPMHTFNLAGYQYGHAPSKPYRWTFGGLTDAGFGMIPLLEAGESQDWPF